MTPLPPDIAQDLVPDLEIDITLYRCPMTFVRTRLALDRLAPGQLLSVKLQGDEPQRNVPATAAQLGHEIVSRNDSPNGTTVVLIRKR